MISISFVVGCIVAGVFTLVGLGLMVAGRAIRKHDLTDDSDLFAPLNFVLGLVILLFTVGITAWGMYPYDMQYHRFTHVEGTVEAVEARMLADGNGGTSQNFAVRFKESGDTYRCDDSRCSLLKEGDWLSLWCIREWQYASTSGWGCRFDQSRKGAPR